MVAWAILELGAYVVLAMPPMSWDVGTNIKSLKNGRGRRTKLGAEIKAEISRSAFKPEEWMELTDAHKQEES